MPLRPFVPHRKMKILLIAFVMPLFFHTECSPVLCCGVRSLFLQAIIAKAPAVLQMEDLAGRKLVSNIYFIYLSIKLPSCLFSMHASLCLSIYLSTCVHEVRAHVYGKSIQLMFFHTLPTHTHPHHTLRAHAPSLSRLSLPRKLKLSSTSEVSKILVQSAPPAKKTLFLRSLSRSHSFALARSLSSSLLSVNSLLFY